ncbi:MAG: hypothetical protein LBG90_05705 [Spirochaetaceae bacterium]|jgi:aspartokinase|nr:hypothetical protein [Spirochaetaceae bacterium]
MRGVKFGGTSLGSIEALGKVIEILKQKQDGQVAAASAFSGITDGLIAVAQKAQSGDPAYTDILQPMQDRHKQAVPASPIRRDRHETLSWGKSPTVPAKTEISATKVRIYFSLKASIGPQRQSIKKNSAV